MSETSQLPPMEIALVRVRSLLFAVIAMAIVGTGAELLLIEHTEEFTQIIPLIVLGLGAIALGLVWTRPSRFSVQQFRVVMGLFIVAGVLGVILHYRGNAEFELEMRPTMAGLELFWESLTGATPALAPGNLVPVGLVGLIAVFRHPSTCVEETRSNDRERHDVSKV